MAVYDVVNENVNNIIDFVVNNDNLKLLLAITDANALSQDPNNVDVASLLSSNVNPYAKIPDVEDDAKSLINIYMYNGKNAGRANVHQRDVKIFVDIICHETLWKLDNGIIRPYKILDTLDTKLPTLKASSIRGKLAHIDTVYLTYNSKFCGYRLVYTLTNPTKNCN